VDYAAADEPHRFDEATETLCMTDHTPDPAQSASLDAKPSGQPSTPGKPAKAKKEENFFVFLVKLVLVVLAFRSFIFAPFNIPSESMLPRLENGDYLLASKWSYGFSRYSLPLSVPLIPGRIFARQPDRGDVVIFKAPPFNDTDYIKRVIGLPGDQIQVTGGVLHINGVAVPKVRVADAVIPEVGNTRCYHPAFERRAADGSPTCQYPRYRETLPGGVSYYVLDFGPYAYRPDPTFDPDNTGVYIVPEGHFFAMGDNRDNSMDSRFPAVPGGGIGIVPQENLVGKAQIMMFSTNGTASWFKPWTWLTATRWSRIGSTI
jgi:signal peptidase I